MNKPARFTVACDFDGVLHSYDSPWVAPHVIPDGPVEGALEWLMQISRKFDIAITSTRCKTWRGRRAMRNWLIDQYHAIGQEWETTPAWFRDFICETAFADPWEDEVEWAVQRILSKVTFPKHKPAALVYLDDRAMRFTGPQSFPSVKEIHLARPWNKG